MMISVNQTQFKILHLLDAVPAERRTTNFLASKLKIHQNTIRNHLGVLKELGLINPFKSDHQSVVYYHLTETVVGRVNEVVCCVGGV